MIGLFVLCVIDSFFLICHVLYPEEKLGGKVSGREQFSLTFQLGSIDRAFISHIRVP